MDHFSASPTQPLETTNVQIMIIVIMVMLEILMFLSMTASLHRYVEDMKNFNKKYKIEILFSHILKSRENRPSL